MSKVASLFCCGFVLVLLASRERERPEGQSPTFNNNVPPVAHAPGSPKLEAGFGEADITPEVGAGKKPVYLAGFGKNRVATGVHDPLLARAVVFRHGDQKIALISVDVIGLFQDRIAAIRKQLAGFSFILVSSTHNHEGPDTMGMWGASFFQSGVDPGYMQKVEKQIVHAVRQADKSAQPVRARIGTVRIPDLLHDNREPYIKHDELVAIELLNTEGKKAGVIVQWNCHPETLDDKNTLISADFVASTVQALQKTHRCPVVYFTGTVGGLMTSLHVPVKDAQGNDLKDGTFAKTERFGLLVAQAADRALANARPLSLAPIKVVTREIYLPTDNQFFILGYRLGVLDRPGYLWQNDPTRAEPLHGKTIPQDKKLCIRSELSWLRLGDLDIAAIPGEIYPELVLGKVQDPADAGADYPKAEIEPGIYDQLKGPHRMIIGLACDEIGYILPKRQWDEKPPYCYGRKKSQYGEVNSLGPDTAPLLCNAFKDMLRGK